MKASLSEGKIRFKG